MRSFLRQSLSVKGGGNSMYSPRWGRTCPAVRRRCSSRLDWASAECAFGGLCGSPPLVECKLRPRGFIRTIIAPYFQFDTLSEYRPQTAQSGANDKGYSLHARLLHAFFYWPSVSRYSIREGVW